MKEDETAFASSIAVATPHYLESWGDVSIVKGSYAITQPTIRPLFDTVQFQDALLSWNGNAQSYYDYIRSSYAGAKTWNQLVHDGVEFTSLLFIGLLELVPILMVLRLF